MQFLTKNIVVGLSLLISFNALFAMSKREKCIQQIDQLTQKQKLPDLTEQIRKFHGVKSEVKVFSLFSSYEWSRQYLVSLYTTLNSLKNLNKGEANLELLETFYLNVYKKLTGASQPQEIKRVRVVLNKLELFIGALSCMAVGGIAGWFISSWLNK